MERGENVRTELAGRAAARPAPYAAVLRMGTAPKAWDIRGWGVGFAGKLRRRRKIPATLQGSGDLGGRRQTPK